MFFHFLFISRICCKHFLLFTSSFRQKKMFTRQKEWPIGLRKKAVEDFQKRVELGEKITQRRYAEELRIGEKTFSDWLEAYKKTDGYKGYDLNKKRLTKKPKQNDDVSVGPEDLEDVTNYIFGNNDINVNISIDREIVGSSRRMNFYKCRKSNDQELYDHLFSIEKVMTYYLNGEPQTVQNCEERAELYDKRWREGVPFSGMVARHKVTDEFMGLLVIGFADEPNSAEIAGLVRKEYWEGGYAGESMSFLVKFALTLFQENRKLKGGEDFKRMVATCHKKNFASWYLLVKNGFRLFKRSEMHGGRLHYEFMMPEEFRKVDFSQLNP